MLIYKYSIKLLVFLIYTEIKVLYILKCVFQINLIICIIFNIYKN